MWDDYHVFFIVTLVFTRMLLGEIYHLIELPFHWLIDEAMFVRLLDELIIGFCYSDLTWKTGGFELSLTITLYYKQTEYTPKWNHRQSLIVNFYQVNSELFRRNSEGVLKICSKFAGEHLCRSPISIKLLCNFIEIARRHGCFLQSNFTEIAFRHRCFPVNLRHILRTPFPRNTSGSLLLVVKSPKALKTPKGIIHSGKKKCFQIFRLVISNKSWTIKIKLVLQLKKCVFLFSCEKLIVFSKNLKVPSKTFSPRNF